MGSIEGRNVAIDISSVDGHFEQLPVIADNFARRKVALMFASSGVAAMAAQEATQGCAICGQPAGVGRAGSPRRGR
jgi:hypothetical protein